MQRTESHGGANRQAVNDHGELALPSSQSFKDAPKTGSRSGLTHSAFEDEEPAVFMEGEAEDGAAPVGEGVAVQESVQQTIAEVRR